MFQVNSRDNRRRCDMSKVHNNNSRGMASLCENVGAITQGLSKDLAAQCQQYTYKKMVSNMFKFNK